MNETVLERINGFKFTVYPTVFNPSTFYSGKYFAEFITGLDKLDGKRVLDMGCGTGVVSVFAASKGAQCLAVDKNPMSVKASLTNSTQNNLKKNIESIESDLFDRIDKSYKFDLIFFNPPYYKGEPKSQMEYALKAGENYEVIKHFIEHSNEYLAENGIIYLIISSDMPVKMVEELFTASGFSFEIVKQIDKFFETFYITKSFLMDMEKPD